MDTIIQKIVKAAYKYPKNKAVADVNGWYSYERLETITDVIAQTIIRRAERQGIIIPELIIDGKSGPRIAVIMPRTKDFLVACVGILKAGCPIVPIEPGYPNDRIRAILEDCQCNQIITTQEVRMELKSRSDGDVLAEFGFNADTISLMSDIMEMAPAKLHVSTFDLSQNENEGLIIYTSGSTGKPKGVVHSMSVFHVGKRLGKAGGIEMLPGKSWACMAGFTFVASLMDLWVPLMCGGSVYIFNEQERLDIRQMRDAIVTNHIDYMFMPPKLADTMLNAFGDMGLTAIVCAGEKLLNRPDTKVKIIDTYGTSEIAGALARVAGKDDDSVVLGRLIDGVRAFLIDSEGNQITEPGVVGEFCFVGETTAICYNNMPELTREKFVPCPFMPGERMFKTGDLMALNKNGEFEFHGRSDYMVKLNGYRVELGEVESVISKHENIAELACVLKKVNGGDNLCLYYVTNDGNAMDENILKDFGAQKLASYMVPSIYVHLDKLPRNANGKIDRKNLPEPVVEMAEYVAPATPTEEKMQAILADVLRLDKTLVGVTTELQSLGLNSMLSMQVVVKVASELHLNISVKMIQTMGNVRMISDLIDSGTLQPNTEFKAHPKRKVYPATNGMLGYMKAAKEGYSTRLVINVMRIEDMTLDKMVPALKAVFDAHPSIKTKATYQGDTPVLLRDDDAEMPIKTFRLDSEPDGEWIVKNCYSLDYFHVLNDFMVSYSLIETPNFGYFVCIGSHAILDGSALILQFHDFCTVLSGGKISPETYTIYDYALDEEAYYHSDQLKQDEEYFRNLVGDKVETVIPYDPDPEVDDWLRADMSMTWDRQALDNYCKKNKVRQNSFFASVFMQAMGQMAGGDYVMTSSLHSNRGSMELASVLNLTMRNYPVISNNIIPLDSPCFADRMRSDMHSIQDQVTRAMDFQFYDYYSMVGLGDKSPNSFDKSIFLYYVGLTDKLTNPVEEKRMLGCEVENIDPLPKGFKMIADDSLKIDMVTNAEGQYVVTLYYNHKDYHTATIERMRDIMNAYFKKLVNE